MSSSDEENSRDSVSVTINNEPSDHETVIGDNDTPADNNEDTKTEEKSEGEIQLYFHLLQKLGT